MEISLLFVKPNSNLWNSQERCIMHLFLFVRIFIHYSSFIMKMKDGDDDESICACKEWNH